MSGIGVGIGAGIGGASPAVNPNLLRWTEEFDNAVWTKTDVVITADADGAADQAAFGITGGAVLGQVSQTAAATGAAVNLAVTPTPAYVRYDIGGTFDGQLYTLSIEIKSAAADGVTLGLLRTGGFLTAQITSTDDVDPRTLLVKNAQLERGAITDYVHRTT